MSPDEPTPDERETPTHRKPRLHRAARILVVDDDTDFLAFFRELLEGEGYVVETATRGTAAVVTALSHTPDAIVCDLCLPGGDGFEIVDRLRQTVATRDVPMFAITGVSTLEDTATARAALSAGFSGIFHKPVNWPTLRDLLRAVLANT
jgi:two-component system CheB/CheR fusion protein